VLHFVCVQIAVTVALITAAATTMAEKHQENQERSSIIAGKHSGIIHVSIKMWKSRGKQKRNDNKEIWLVKRLKLSFSFGFWLQGRNGKGRKTIFKLVFRLLEFPMK